MKSVEFLKPNTRSTSRSLLFALALSVAAVLGPKIAEAAPGDGILVCSVGRSTKPSLINFNPLKECPPVIGEMVRLDRGQETVEYMREFYPNGVVDDGIFATARRLVRAYSK